MIDKGFESGYTKQELSRLSGLFSSEQKLYQWLEELHFDRNVIDLKRGEFYPEILRATKMLIERLADLFDVEPGQVLPNFGSNGSIDTILTYASIRANGKSKMLVNTPTYFRNYNSANSKKIDLIRVQLNKLDWNVDLEQFTKKIASENPDIVCLVSPNNPTGLPIRDSDLKTIIDATPDDTLIMLDRTLANTHSEISSKELLKIYNHKRMLILHSFSKYFGFSHLRIGFALGSNLELAQEIKPLLPLGLNFEALIKAILMVDSIKKFKPSQEIIDRIKQNQLLISHLCSEGTPYSCSRFTGNYCLVSSDRKEAHEILVRELERNGAQVMNGQSFPEPLENTIRIHVGGEKLHLQKIIDSLEIAL